MKMDMQKQGPSEKKYTVQAMILSEIDSNIKISLLNVDLTKNSIVENVKNKNRA